MSMLQEGQILLGPSFNEPMRVETVRQGGNGAWTIGVVGIRSEQFRRVILFEAVRRHAFQKASATVRGWWC